jgi:MFS family permease
MNTALNLNAVQEATVVSALLFPGAAAGALVGGRLADRLGRRGTLLACAGLFLVGALGCALAPTVSIMIAFRIILGLGVGAAAVTCPLYLAEMAPTHLRGRMVTINELMIVTGQMLAFAINALLDALIHNNEVWRIMLAVASVPAIALLAGMLLEKSGLGVSASLVATVAVGVTSVLTTVLGIWLLGYVGRRRMLVIGFSGVVGAQALLAVVFLLPRSDVVSYVILAAVISFLFPIVNQALGSTGTFSLFVLVNLASLGFVLKFVPETRGRSLEELEEHFRSSGEATAAG